MTTKGVKILWKTDGESNRIYVVFCDFWVPLAIHFGDQGQHKKKRVSCWLPFLGWGPGGFWDAFWLFFGKFLVAFWKPLGAGLLELLGSCGKDLGCFSVFFIRFLVFIQPVLSNVGECRG